jgi:regulator of sirC expression with transglutaminase-like and TPR domain
MDPTGRFVELVARPAPQIPLDEAAVLIAAHDHPVDVADVLRRLDALADGAPDGADGPALAAHLFSRLGFAGNRLDYADPRNSFLDEVLDRRLGIPISLSVLLLEVARRRGVDLVGVGMPGHFLVGAGDGLYLDPYHGGEVLDVDGCRARFTQVRGDLPFDPGYLAPVDSAVILGRMLSNLVGTYLARAPRHAIWALVLRTAIGGLPRSERREAAVLLGELGRFGEAAAALHRLADEDPSDDASRRQALALATRLRARAN